MSIGWTMILAVVPLGRRPGWGQVLLSYLPIIGLVLVAAVVLAVLKRLAWRWYVTGFSRRAQFVMIGSAVVLVISAIAIPIRYVRGPRAGGQVIAGDRWSTFMCNAERTGLVAGGRGPTAGQKIWTFRDGLSRSPFSASPAVVGSRVYVGSDNRQLYCLNADSGEVVWTFTAACELFASPVVAGGRVYLGEGLHHSSNAKLYCLDAATGGKIWEFATAGHIEFSPTLFDGKLYFGAGPDGIYCVDALGGRRIWHYPSAHVDLSPAVTEEGVFFGCVYGEPAFCRLDGKDGKLIWKRPAPYGVCGSPSTDGARVYFGLGNGNFDMSHANPVGSVYCLSAEDGAVLWSAKADDAVLTTIALWGGSAYFGSRDGRLYCVDAQTGQRRWAYDAKEPVLSSPAVADGRVYFGCNDGLIHCVDASTGGKIWSYDTSQAAFNTEVQVIASPAIANGRLYVGSTNFVFFCLGDASAPTTGPR